MTLENQPMTEEFLALVEREHTHGRPYRVTAQKLGCKTHDVRKAARILLKRRQMPIGGKWKPNHEALRRSWGTT
jgi:hypothetical protein